MPSVELDYAALTIDTSAFISHGMAFDRGILKQLEQFKTSPVKLVLSEMVLHELRKHLRENVKESRAKLRSALKSAHAQIGLSTNTPEAASLQLIGTRTDAEIVEDRLKTFIAATAAEIVSPSNVSVQDLVERYCEVEPPFELGRDKKYEFPDAIALMSLDAWASQSGIRLLAVSGDKGWKDFADVSKSIDALEDLANALTHFQPHNAANEIIEALKRLIETGESHEILDFISSMIIENTNEGDVDVAFNSSVYADPDYTEVQYLKHEFLRDTLGRPIVDLVRIEESWLVLRLRIAVHYEVRAVFRMAVWDSIDREYVSLGSSMSKRRDAIESDILVSLTADFSKGIENVKVGEFSLDLDFPILDVGDIEPSLHGE